MSWSGRGGTAIVGVGRSPVQRHTDEPLAAAVRTACEDAVADAGLSLADIDGLATFPSLPYHGASAVDGDNYVSMDYVLPHLGEGGIRWYAQISEGMAASSVIEAVAALLAGLCDRVLVWRALSHPAGRYGATGDTTVAGTDQYTAPWGFSSIIQSHAVAYSRYLSRYDADPVAMADLVTTVRAHAQLNPYAYFNGREMTREDYAESQWVAEPLRVLDCDIPVHGAVALVLTREGLARELRERPAYVLGFAQQTSRTQPSIAYMLGDYMRTGGEMAHRMWEQAGVGPAEVDCAQVYDGFSSSAYYWLESAGFCPEGEAHRFVRDGAVGLGGRLPVNTAGGSLSEGRLHGMGHVAEAALQVMGAAQRRQVPDARVTVAMTGSPLLRSAGLVLGASA